VKQDHPDLSVRRQCSLLSLARSVLYYQPRGESAENLKFMEIIDRQFLETPWYVSRQMARHMQREGHRCGRHRVRRLMRLMRLVPIYQEPKTSKKHPAHKIYPYLLKGLAITRPNQVWCTDISARHLSRTDRVRCLTPDAPRVSVSGGDHGLAQSEGAELAAVEFHGCGLLRRGVEGGIGQIWSARDLQFRSGLAIHQQRIHRGAAGRQGTDLDGRSWSLDRQPDDRKAVAVAEPKVREAKYECVYLNAFETGSEARKGIGTWISYYNEKRPHSSHGLLTPSEAYDTPNQNLKAAA
jgi:putative transposase